MFVCNTEFNSTYKEDTVAISKKVYEEILAKTDIVQIIKHYLGENALRQSSPRSNSFIGLCPFHKEKTPSFSVNTRNQYFHCYGCGESGRAIYFVLRYLRLGSSMEALLKIGAISGIRIPNGKTNPARARRRIRKNTARKMRREERKKWETAHADREQVPF